MPSVGVECVDFGPVGVIVAYNTSYPKQDFQMNRKLQHSVTALSATAAVFGLLLLAGGPPPMAVPMPGAEAVVAVETLEASTVDMAEAESTTRRHRHQRR